MGKVLRRLLPLLIILVLVMVFFRWRSHTKKADLRKDAILYFKEEDYSKSIEYLEKALTYHGLFDSKLDQDIRCYLAESYYQMKEYKKAESLYHKLQGQDSDNSLYYILEGKSCMAAEDYDKALKIFQRGWDKTKDPAFLSRICEIYTEQDDYDSALEYARQGIGDGGSADRELMYDLIIIYEKSQDYKSAYEAAKDYCDKYPDDDRADKELTFLSSRI